MICTHLIAHNQAENLKIIKTSECSVSRLLVDIFHFLLAFRVICLGYGNVTQCEICILFGRSYD
jgi:hypothetical protein